MTGDQDLRTGDLFERRFFFDEGSVDLIAEVEVAGTELRLLDTAVFPAGASELHLGAAAVLRALRSSFADLRGAGFDAVVITGTRLSGATPGRTVEIRVELTKERP